MHIAVIPARAGSKSIPLKNLKPVGKTSLVERAILSAQSAKIFDKVVLTTDITGIWDKVFNITLIKRSPFLCHDHVKMDLVIHNVIEVIKPRDDDWLWILQPTSPFREPQDYKQILEILDKANSVISVKRCFDDHPDRTYTMTDKGLKPLHKTNFTPRQDLLPVYRRNGAYYVFKVGDFLKQNDFYIFPCFPYLMDELRSINVDNHLDLILANAVIEKGMYEG